MKIVFFGDSVTDASRSRTDPADLGTGFVKIAAGRLRLLYPEKDFEILNRGVDGDRTEQLLARIEEDVVKEDPDVVVLEVGINDVWHRYLLGVETTAEQFRANYEELVRILKGTRAKLILLQPFVLNVGDKPRLRPCLKTFNGIIREIAEREGLPLVPMDEIFTGVTQEIPAMQFAADGIHPTHRGCRYLAEFVIKELKKIVE